MDYHEKLSVMQSWVGDNIVDIEEFCVMFDITLDDMIKCFPDALVSAYYKVYVTEEEEDKDEQTQWEERGFHFLFEEGE